MTKGRGSGVGRSIRNREKYLEKKKKGLCTDCNREKEDKNKTRCKKCLRKQAYKQQKYLIKLNQK